MSDFLTNLAARTLAPPTLRPRLRLRFEPESTDAEPAFDGAAREEVAAAPPDPHVDLPAPSPRPRVDPPPVPPSAPRPVARTETIAQQLITHTERHTDRTTERRVIEERHTQTRVAFTPSAQPPAPPTRPHRHDLQPPRAERAVPTARADAHAVKAEARAAAKQPPQTNKPFERASSRSRTPDVPPAEPTVHVSIGRIEVRAATPPAPRAPSRARQVMTIDDYVARQNAKERR